MKALTSLLLTALLVIGAVLGALVALFAAAEFVTTGKALAGLACLTVAILTGALALNLLLDRNRRGARRR